MNNLSDAMYRAAHAAATRGTFLVTCPTDGSISTINALHRKRYGDLRRNITTNPRTGQQTHHTVGILLNRPGRTALRREIAARGHQPIPALEDPAPTAGHGVIRPRPRPTTPTAPAGPRRSITATANPFRLIGSRQIAIPF